tara:strand:- start:655 stop:1974 length:1320 start_codon:yes stop_codon:yes gene_type:complete
MIPANLKFQSKVESAPARRYLTQIQPQGGSSFSPSDTITINIPTRNNTALIPSESYLRGTLSLSCATANATAATFESAGVHGFIQRIRVFHGSNLLEDIDNYAQLAKILYDFQASDDTVKGRLAVTSATNPQYNVTSGTIVRGVNRGATSGVTTTATAVPFAINLVSMVGALAGDKYLPLWEMTAAPLRVEIVLKASVVTSMMSLAGSATAQTFAVSGVNYCGEFLELPDSAVSAIKSGSSSPMQMVLPSFRSYTNSAAITTAGTQVSMPIPAKFSSLKSIFVATRTSQGADGLYPNSHCKYGLTSYNFRIGSEVLPSSAPTSVPEFYSEAVKCFGSLADLSLQPSIDLVSYSLDVPNTIASAGDASLLDSGSFVIGIDTEIYQNADKASIFSGTNTNTSDIFFIANYTPAGNVTILQSAYANYDQVLVFENGVCYSRY